MKVKPTLAAGAAMYAALVAAPLQAQVVSPVEEAQVEPKAVTTEQPAQASNDIIVTATRRSQVLSDVPIAVTVVSGDLVRNAGVQDVRGLSQLAPSLQTSTGQSSATGTTLSIRGIGTGGDNPGFEPAVGVFIDGVYRARAGVALGDLPPLDRVEVLRGPQGTLFGRNTSAGALNIVTQAPTFELGAFGEATYGNFDALNLRGMVNVPLGTAVAVRVDGGYRERDGYIRDVNTDRRFNNVDRYNIRGQALFDAGPLTVRLIADYSKTDEQCCGALNVTPGTTGPVINFLAGQAGLTGIFNSGTPKDRRVAYTPGRDLTEKVEDYGFSTEVNYDLGDVTLTSITAYRDWSALRDMDIDFSGLDRAYRDDYRTGLENFTQEVRAQGTLFDGKLDWLVGGFYLNETLTLTDTVRFGAQANQYVDGLFALNPAAGFEFFNSFGPAVPEFGQVLLAINPQLAADAAQNPALFQLLNTPIPGAFPGAGQVGDEFRVKTDAFALFTHNIINVTDALSLTLGLRYNYEKKDISADLRANSPTCDFFLNPATAIYTGAIAQAAPAALLLGCNPAVNSEFNGTYADDRSESEFTGTAKIAYKVVPELLAYASYDRGFKSGGYNLDRAGFDTVLLGGNGPQIGDLEFTKETVDSFELGLKADVSRQFSLNVAGFYQKYDGLQSLIFSGTNFVVQNVPNATSKGVEVEALLRPANRLTVQLGYTYLQAEFDSSNDFTGTPLAGSEGRQFGNEPRNRITGALTWTPSLTSGINGLAHVDYRFVSDHIVDSTTDDLTANDAYIIVNARIGIATVNKRFQLEAFVENLFDEYYNVAAFFVPEQDGAAAVYPNPPRFYGVRLRAGF